MEKDPAPKPKKSSRNAWVFIGVLLLIPIIGIAIPMCMTDGTEKFSGEQKKAATVQINNVSDLKDGVQKLTSGTIKYRVENVYNTPAEVAESWCSNYYKPDKTYYSVVLGEYTIFGIKTNEFVRHDACILM